MSGTEATGELGVELGQMVAQIPGPIAERLAAGAAAVTASGVAPGIAIGEHAPGFILPNALGQPVALAERLTVGPVVVSFYRGEWCPFCNTELRSLQARLPQFQTHGASLLAISPQSPDHSLSVTQKHSLDFDVLSDVHQEVIRAYRVQFTVPGDVKDLYRNAFHNDLTTHTANASWDLPIPATFVIDRDGIVRARYVSADYTTRMEPAAIDAALAALD